MMKARNVPEDCSHIEGTFIDYVRMIFKIFRDFMRYRGISKDFKRATNFRVFLMIPEDYGTLHRL